jgi:hypothetical protein
MKEAGIEIAGCPIYGNPDALMTNKEEADTWLLKPRPDWKWVEPAGRNWLIGELFRAGFDVARPELDRGIDLIAYHHLDGKRSYLPIQIKAAADASFSLESKYQKIPGLTMVYVWGLRDYAHTKCFALSFAQAFRIMKERAHTRTNSWKKGRYSTTRPSEVERALLAPFEMNSSKWRKLFDEMWKSE